MEKLVVLQLLLNRWSYNSEQSESPLVPSNVQVQMLPSIFLDDSSYADRDGELCINCVTLISRETLLSVFLCEKQRNDTLNHPGG